MNFRFYEAGREDDADIRRLVKDSPMPGKVTVSFQREPDYFEGCSVMGNKTRVYLGRDYDSSKLALVVSTSEFPRWIFGRKVDTGYLGQLRVAAEYLSRRAPLRGLEFLMKMEAPSPDKVYMAVIPRENRISRGIFTGVRNYGFPRLHHVTELVTSAISLGGEKRRISHPYTVERGSRKNLDEVVIHLNKWGRNHDFFPYYTAEDFLDNRILKGFHLDDLVILRKGKEILGTLGIWDQSGFKQSVVDGYSDFLRRLRPGYNVLAGLTGFPRLPAPGETIDSVYGCCLCLKDNNCFYFRILLREVYNLAVTGKFSYLMIGLSEEDPLVSELRTYRKILYHSDLYIFRLVKEAYSESGGFPGGGIRKPGGVPRIEIASL